MFFQTKICSFKDESKNRIVHFDKHHLYQHDKYIIFTDSK